MVACFVGFGLVWAQGLAAAREDTSTYPSGVEDPAAPEPATWLIDGYNVLHAGLLGGRDRADWWTEPRRNEVMERVRRFDAAGAELWVVFDGPRPESPRSRTGAGSARPCQSSRTPPTSGCWPGSHRPDPARVAVVTADRRWPIVRATGARRCISPGAFLARCPG